MNIEMKVAIAGQFHGRTDVQKGDIVDVDDENAVRYCNLGYAVPATTAVRVEVPVERAIPVEPTVETARVEVPEPVRTLPTPLDEPAGAVESSDSPKPVATQRKPSSAAPNARRNR